MPSLHGVEKEDAMYHLLIKRANPAPLAEIKRKAAEAFDGALDAEDREALNALYTWSRKGRFTDDFARTYAVGRIPYGSTFADIVAPPQPAVEGVESIFANISMLLHDYPDLLQDLGIEVVETGDQTLGDFTAFEHLK
jgi:hypothetical protein